MVIALLPGKFYGSSLPRPWFYSNVKHNADGLRVDPPPSVLNPLLSWARDAHWSMGGLSFQRHRLQGRIEGNIDRLRRQQERKHRLDDRTVFTNKAKKARVVEEELVGSWSSSSDEEVEGEVEIEEEGEAEETIAMMVVTQKKRARKLGDEFDRIAIAGGLGARGELKERRVGASQPSDVSRSKGGRKRAVANLPRRSTRISPRKG